MNVVQQLENDFIDHSLSLAKATGMPDLPAKLISILLINNQSLSIEELSEKSGYSLSAVSTAMNMISRFHNTNKTRKKRKIYYDIDKDPSSMMKEMFSLMLKRKLQPTEKYLPELIKKYDGKKEVSEQIIFLKEYQKKLSKISKLFKKIILELNSL